MDVSKLEKIIGKPIRARPDGFGITVSEYMKLYRCGKQTAQSMLNSGVEKGLLKEEMNVKGRGGRVIVYYLKDENL